MLHKPFATAKISDLRPVAARVEISVCTAEGRGSCRDDGLPEELQAVVSARALTSRDECPCVLSTFPSAIQFPAKHPAFRIFIPLALDELMLFHRLLTATLLSTFLIALGHQATAQSIAGKRPNIVFILTDDQGYGDISAHGNPVLKTPNLDRLRSEGVRFTDFHVSPTCSPTRSALLTGRHEFKNGITHTILERERLTLDAITLTQVLKASGYTAGIFGKWHLGDEAEYQPNKRGFDEVFIHGGGGIGQIYPGSCGDAPDNRYFNPTILHNGVFEKTTGYCTDVFYTQALSWIESKAKSNQPFYAYIPSNAPHGPYIARPEDKALYEGKGLEENTESFFGMIHNIDQNVGKILGKLDELGIAKNTLVIFMNDNGGTAGVSVFNAGMHGSKGSPWMGGTRASSFWRWLGTLQPGDRGQLAAHIDFFPTIASIVGATLNEKAKTQIEGRSLVPLLESSTAPWDDRVLFTHQGRWPKFADPNESKYSNCSVRNTQYHLVSINGGSNPAWELYDVKKDPSESKNIADENPKVVEMLSGAFDKFWAESLPMMVNEKVVGPKINPFQEIYYKQFGGSPTEEALKRMDSAQPFPSGGKAKQKDGKGRRKAKATQ